MAGKDGVWRWVVGAGPLGIEPCKSGHGHVVDKYHPLPHSSSPRFLEKYYLLEFDLGSLTVRAREYEQERPPRGRVSDLDEAPALPYLDSPLAERAVKLRVSTSIACCVLPSFVSQETRFPFLSFLQPTPHITQWRCTGVKGQRTTPLVTSRSPATDTGELKHSDLCRTFASISQSTACQNALYAPTRC